MKTLISAVLMLFLAGCGSNENQQSEPSKAADVAQATKTEAAQPEVTKAPEAAAGTVVETKAEVAVQADGNAIYKVCSGCHGDDASKSALGKSQIIKGWDAKKIADALHGYKNGTYGAAMKGVMAGQVSKLSDEDIKAVSEHISKL